MLERLDYVKLVPHRVLDAGSGPPRGGLAERYPQAAIIALDFSLPMLPKRGLLARLAGSKRWAVCADLERLPFADASVELVWSNMALHYLSDPLAAFTEFRRVLAANGLLMFSTLGPDTLKELRSAAGAARVHGFVDMHDLGDMLIAAGLSAPVMDMEMLEFAYPDADTLLKDLRLSGQTSARADRPRGLSGKAFGARLRRALGDKPKASFEVVYGHAWKATEVKTVRIFKSRR
ncbi:MAG: methyltransferase domain-containing protein [Betaproteobacteria bacterium]|nr:MAG: methyltransferase domain-containing protein [Betaproteobacteria bacterium]